MIELNVKNDKARVRMVKGLIESAGNLMASVWFNKRTDGKKRKMVFRLGVKEPTYATKPSNSNFKKTVIKDRSNCQMTVLDVNKIRYDKKGHMSGRGDWRTIPLESVTRIAVNGKIYRFFN